MAGQWHQARSPPNPYPVSGQVVQRVMSPLLPPQSPMPPARAPHSAQPIQQSLQAGHVQYVQVVDQRGAVTYVAHQEMLPSSVVVPAGAAKPQSEAAPSSVAVPTPSRSKSRPKLAAVSTEESGPAPTSLPGQVPERPHWMDMPTSVPSDSGASSSAASPVQLTGPRWAWPQVPHVGGNLSPRHSPAASPVSTASPRHSPASTPGKDPTAKPPGSPRPLAKEVPAAAAPAIVHAGLPHESLAAEAKARTTKAPAPIGRPPTNLKIDTAAPPRTPQMQNNSAYPPPRPVRGGSPQVAGAPPPMTKGPASSPTATAAAALNHPARKGQSPRPTAPLPSPQHKKAQVPPHTVPPAHAAERARLPPSNLPSPQCSEPGSANSIQTVQQDSKDLALQQRIIKKVCVMEEAKKEQKEARQRTPERRPQSARGRKMSKTPERKGSKPTVMGLKHIKEALADEHKLQQYASECFNKFDSNRDGVLSFEELNECLVYMNSSLGVGDFTEREVSHYLRRFDTDGNQLLSQGEYKHLYRSLLLVKLHEYEPTPFSREMFISRRKGRPEDHYSVMGVLGAGSFGVVRKVQCRQTKIIRVMKTVDKQKAVSGGYPLTLVMEEIDKLKTLDHPAVLRLFEYFADTRALYLITDLLPGGDLLQAVEGAYASKRPLSEPWVRDVFRQVSEGVAYIHTKGVMHKDLKLENIMLCSVDPPEAVVIDVGLAELFPPQQADSFHSADAAGTLATMAPEVIRGSFTYKCDVWSLGCCLFALLCRKPRTLQEPADVPDAGDAKQAEGPSYEYFYPFIPPANESRDELKAYLVRQKKGVDLTRLRCSETAACLVKQVLSFDERARPAMTQVLAHPWLQGIRSKEPVLESAQLDSLLHFPRTNALQQAVLLDVASQLPLNKLRELSSLFESMDKDGNGVLDATELAEALERAGLPNETAKETAQKLARGGGGAVEFSRFVAALVLSRRDLLQRNMLRGAFDRLDANGDGFVSRTELRRLLERGAADVEGLAAAAKEPSPKGHHVSFAKPKGDQWAEADEIETAELEGAELEEDEANLAAAEEALLAAERAGVLGEAGVKRLRAARAARAAREAFTAIGGNQRRLRVSFDSLHRHFAELVA